MAAALWLGISLALAALAGRGAQSAWEARRRAGLRREAVRLRLHYQDGEISRPAERWTYLRELGEDLRVDEVFKGLGDRPPLVVLSVRHRIGPAPAGARQEGGYDAVARALSPRLQSSRRTWSGVQGGWHRDNRLDAEVTT